ncbi:hypothetical protein [Thermoflavimicrobium dichotomicum]|uniref:Uncharacterized protein n=1 Tax=Thermoflavimicrobium dichotomicum TaxID=46223 RepID=A0A1I3T716_9BACL|nr:hypothetical protein [Thermoflavimicrobium dichotomicum]SFJ66363.1 hypothetical protein SAMN05421852_11621 [Thermoflavimicrobium dichotomicum]
MSSAYYQYLILLPSESPFCLNEMQEKIQKRLEQLGEPFSLASKNHQLTLTIGQWNFYIYLNHDPYVQIESAEIAKRCHSERAAQIRGIKQRLETVGDPDFNMDYFHTVLFILEILEQDYHAHIFDPMEGTFIN